MTPSELLQHLRPLRLPLDTVAPTPGDVVVAFCLGLASALALTLILSPLLRRRISLRSRIAGELDALKGLAPAERFAAQARLFVEVAGRDAVPADWRDALYGGAPPPDAEALDREIFARARQRRSSKRNA